MPTEKRLVDILKENLGPGKVITCPFPNDDIPNWLEKYAKYRKKCDKIKFTIGYVPPKQRNYTIRSDI
ncbi:MAG: hypothetical protein PHF86_11075 [Candidatus Nanoarchaeia archaeon]|nr:hypothetical protein [Candidatus Nanoarchaeia archaeon]